MQRFLTKVRLIQGFKKVGDFSNLRMGGRKFARGRNGGENLNIKAINIYYILLNCR